MLISIFCKVANPISDVEFNKLVRFNQATTCAAWHRFFCNRDGSIQTTRRFLSRAVPTQQNYDDLTAKFPAFARCSRIDFLQCLADVCTAASSECASNDRAAALLPPSDADVYTSKTPRAGLKPDRWTRACIRAGRPSPQSPSTRATWKMSGNFDRRDCTSQHGGLFFEDKRARQWRLAWE